MGPWWLWPGVSLPHVTAPEGLERVNESTEADAQGGHCSLSKPPYHTGYLTEDRSWKLSQSSMNGSGLIATEQKQAKSLPNTFPAQNPLPRHSRAPWHWSGGPEALAEPLGI
jgi:hypothetical protein